MTNLSSVGFDDEGWCYTGGENGHIQVWSDACTVVKQIKAHTAAITGIVCEKGYLISGGKDKKIAIISTQGGNFKLEKFVDLGASFVRSIDLINGNLLVGLKNGSICEFKNALTEETKETVLSQAHFEGELWGVAVVNDSHVVTCGDDNRMMLWNTDTHTCERIGKISDHKPKNVAKAKGVTASSQSAYPAN
jgi:WD40 repeat protein